MITVEIVANDYATADLATALILRSAPKTSVVGLGRGEDGFFRAVAVPPLSDLAATWARLNLPAGARVFVRA